MDLQQVVEHTSQQLAQAREHAGQLEARAREARTQAEGQKAQVEQAARGLEPKIEALSSRIRITRDEFKGAVSDLSQALNVQKQQLSEAEQRVRQHFEKTVAAILTLKAQQAALRARFEEAHKSTTDLISRTETACEQVIGGFGQPLRELESFLGQDFANQINSDHQRLSERDLVMKAFVQDQILQPLTQAVTETHSRVNELQSRIQEKTQKVTDKANSTSTDALSQLTNHHQGIVDATHQNVGELSSQLGNLASRLQGLARTTDNSMQTLTQATDSAGQGLQQLFGVVSGLRQALQSVGIG